MTNSADTALLSLDDILSNDGKNEFVEHYHYEVNMMHHLFLRLTTESDKQYSLTPEIKSDGVIMNALLESFAIHCYCLIRFWENSGINFKDEIQNIKRKIENQILNLSINRVSRESEKFNSSDWPIVFEELLTRNIVANELLNANKDKN